MKQEIYISKQRAVSRVSIIINFLNSTKMKKQKKSEGMFCIPIYVLHCIQV